MYVESTWLGEAVETKLESLSTIVIPLLGFKESLSVLHVSTINKKDKRDLPRLREVIC